MSQFTRENNYLLNYRFQGSIHLPKNTPEYNQNTPDYPRIPLEYPRIPKNTQRIPLEYPRIPQNTLEYPRIPLEYPRIPKNTQEYPRIPLEYPKIPLECPRIPQNTNNIKILKDLGFLFIFYSVDGDISQKATLIELLFVLLNY